MDLQGRSQRSTITNPIDMVSSLFSPCHLPNALQSCQGEPTAQSRFPTAFFFLRLIFVDFFYIDFNIMPLDEMEEEGIKRRGLLFIEYSRLPIDLLHHSC